MNMKDTNISSKAVIGKNLIIGRNSIIEDDAIVGDDVVIGNNVIVKRTVIIGNGCNVEDNVILGYSNLTKIYDDKVKFDKAVISEETLIRSNSVIYIGCSLGQGCRIGHNVIMREGTKVGDRTSLGCLVKCEGYASIGSDCSIHSLSSITPFMEIEDFVFIGPGVITVNDAKIDYKRDVATEKKGPRIKRGARVGGNTTICPAVTIGREAFVAAGSLVARDVPDYCKAAGVPARVIGRIPAANFKGGV